MSRPSASAAAGASPLSRPGPAEADTDAPVADTDAPVAEQIEWVQYAR